MAPVGSWENPLFVIVVESPKLDRAGMNDYFGFAVSGFSHTRELASVSKPPTKQNDGMPM